MAEDRTPSGTNHFDVVGLARIGTIANTDVCPEPYRAVARRTMLHVRREVVMGLIRELAAARDGVDLVSVPVFLIDTDVPEVDRA